jgi:hypothetical protein
LKETLGSDSAYPLSSGAAIGAVFLPHSIGRGPGPRRCSTREETRGETRQVSVRLATFRPSAAIGCAGDCHRGDASGGLR